MNDYRKSKEQIIEKFKNILLYNGEANYANKMSKNCNQRTLCSEYINNIEQEND